ncbi:hypothetical protein HDV05_001990 [Chytridiales sp. JEL 0842]|nr:hypothetical protein HDV05_001990 [Chytridiales sp. JEL 0842]
MGFNLKPAGNPGYWGPVTSTLDWCEENYIHSHYIAELFNTLSMIFLTLLAYWGLQQCRYTKSEWKEEVGFWLCVPIAIDAIGVTAIYLAYPNPIFHEVSYGVQVAFAVLYPFYQLNSPTAKSHAHLRTKSKEILILHVYAIFNFVGGFVIWNVENQFCDDIRSWRQGQGLVGYMFLQLHAWWHYGTAVGSYASCLMNMYVRLLVLGRGESVELRWWMGFLPWVGVTTGNEGETRRKLKK